MEPPFDVQRIDHLVLRVRDLARSIRFYGEVLGCHIERQREHLGLAHLRAGASMIDLVDVAGKLGARGGAQPWKGATSTTCACASILSMKRRSGRIWRVSASHRWGRRRSTSAREATDCRCTSRIPTATRSS